MRQPAYKVKYSVMKINTQFYSSVTMTLFHNYANCQVPLVTL